MTRSMVGRRLPPTLVLNGSDGDVAGLDLIGVDGRCRDLVLIHHHLTCCWVAVARRIAGCLCTACIAGGFEHVASSGTATSGDDEQQWEELAHGFSSEDDETSVPVLVCPTLE